MVRPAAGAHLQPEPHPRGEMRRVDLCQHHAATDGYESRDEQQRIRENGEPLEQEFDSGWELRGRRRTGGVQGQSVGKSSFGFRPMARRIPSS